MPKKKLEPGSLPGLQPTEKTRAEYERLARAGMRIKEILEQWPVESAQSRASASDSRSRSAAVELLQNLDPSEAIERLRAGEASPLLQRVVSDWIVEGCKRPSQRQRNSFETSVRYERAREALSLYEGFLAAAPKKRARKGTVGTNGHETPADRAFTDAVAWTAKAAAVNAAKGNAAEHEKLIARISQQLKNDLRQLIEGRWRKQQFQREPREE